MPRVGPLLLGIQTDRGLVREENEDAYGIPSVSLELLTARGYLIAVADGVGGHGNGQEASALVITTLYEQYYGAEPITLLRAIQMSNMAVRRQAMQASERNHRMSSTLVTLLFHDRTLQIAHVGDSRAYMVRQGVIYQLTSDHSLVQEQVLAGLLNAESARSHQRKNIITRAVGSDSTVDVDIATNEDLQPGDIFVLCSDGLTNHVDDATIADTASRYAPEQATSLLVQLANQAGGLDNITVAVICYSPRTDHSPFQISGSSRGRGWEYTLLWLLLAIGIGGTVGIIVMIAYLYLASR